MTPQRDEALHSLRLADHGRLPSDQKHGQGPVLGLRRHGFFLRAISGRPAVFVTAPANARRRV